ncbi:hypothetical protein TNCV_3909511 [Trichonephila clavipes]|nr:hypothetical protein TNCV_3909511 [Trichonephila clavipes]
MRKAEHRARTDLLTCISPSKWWIFTDQGLEPATRRRRLQVPYHDHSTYQGHSKFSHWRDVEIWRIDCQFRDCPQQGSK